MKTNAIISLLLALILLLTSCNVWPSEHPFDQNDNNDSSITDKEPGSESNDSSITDNESKPDDDDGLDNVDLSSSNVQTNVNDFIYEINDGAVTITKYIGSSSCISIPDRIEDCPVTSIKAGAFVREAAARSANHSQSKANQTIYLPESIDIIEDGAFGNDRNIYVTNREEKPDGWKDSSVGGDAGSEDDEGGNVYYKYKGDDYFIINDIVYLYNYNLKGFFAIKCFDNSSEIFIPSSINNIPVNNIGREAFKDCVFLEKITLSKNTTYIYHSAFENCVALKEINFKSKIISKILSKAFYNCSSLEKVILPEGCCIIKSQAFANCGSLTELYIPLGISEVSKTAFSGTTVDTIYYGGYNIFDYLWLNELPSYTNLVCGERKAVEGISSISSVKNLDLGIEVTIRGYVASNCENDSNKFIVVDENNENGILVQIRINDMISSYNVVAPSFGEYVEIVGYTSNYNGLFSISSVRSIEVVGESKEIEPIKVKNNELNKHYEDYLYRYVELEGIVKHMEMNFTYLNGLDLALFSRAAKNPMLVGSKVSVRGTIVCFGNVYEIQYSYDDVTINQEANTKLISITEAKTLPLGSQVTVQGCVATYITSNSFLIVDEKNQDGIVIYIPSGYTSSELPKFGDLIEITGFTQLYNNMFEITNINSFSVIGYKELEPIKISLDEEWNDYASYAYRYIEFEGVVNTELSETRNTYFYNIPIIHYGNTTNNPLLTAKKVIFRGTVLIYNSTYQLRATYDNIVIIENLSDQ